MSEFEYLSVLVSIVLGLGISQVLGSAAQMIRYRRSTQFYLPTLLWMAMIFLAHVQIWWAVFDLRDVGEWSFVAFLLVLAIPTLVYVLSVLLVPDFDREERVDLRASYYENRVWFYGLFALLPLVSLLQEYTISGFIRFDLDPVFRLSFVGLAVVGMLSASERLHPWLSAIALAGFGAYIGTLFLELA